MTIRLIINTENQENELQFSKESIYIGNFSENADVFLSHENLSLSKLQITLEDTSFKAINLANDPFTSINGNPFGKTDLQHLDILQIGDTTIQCLLPVTTPIAVESFDNAISSEDLIELESLFQQVELLENQEHRSPQIESLPETKIEDILSPPQVPNTTVVFDQQYDDEQHPPWYEKEEEKDPPSGKTGNKLKYILVSLLIPFLGVLVAMGFTFYEYNKKVMEEELKASRAITDVTLALTYAKINHIKPSTQNWSSPDFLYHNLQGVLSKKYPTTLEVNSQGQIGNTSYILRIYTDSNLSRFLVIAQPGHNLSQWWIPKSVIVVDTNEMMIRRLKDLRGLNRLLTNPQPLDGKNGEFVFDLVHTGEIIPLASLASKKQSNGFSPPKALAMIRPGAENYIYNAPRYYPLTESIIKKTFILMNKPENALDITMLIDDIESVAIFPDIVFYSSEGITQAIKAQKTLQRILPHKKLLVAYLKYNMKGREVNSNLLISDDSSLPPFEETWKKNEPVITSVDPEPPVNIEIVQPPVKKLIQRPQKRDTNLSDATHPLFQKLLKLKSAREIELEPHHEKIKELLADHKNTVVIGFSQLFREALKEYEAIDREQQIKILKEIQGLYQEYSEVPLEKIMHYVKQSGLESLVSDSLKKREMAMADANTIEIAVKSQIAKISSSQYLEELEHHAEHTFEILSILRLPNVEKLISYQNLVRYHVLSKLSDYLLTPDLKLPPEAFHADAEGILINILHKSWVFDPTEYHFFLNEFDKVRSELQ